MKGKKKTILIILLVVFVLIQFYPMDKPSVVEDNPNDLITTNSIPKDIASKLKAACYDCNSNESTFPWYASIAPTKWLVYDHINEGREELNFSNWNALSTDDKSDILDDISSIILEGEMPLKGYTILHSVAKLSEADREAIASWADEMLDTLYD
jgi:hypothetical protein